MFRTENRWMNALSWFHSVLLFSGFYMVLAAAFNLEEQEVLKIWFGSLWLFVPVISSWVFIRKLKGFIGYLLGGILIVALVTAVSQNLLTLIFSVLIFGIRAYVRVIRGRMNDKELPGEMKEIELWEIPTLLDQPQVYHWILFIVFYITLIYLKQNELLKWMFGALLVEIFVTYIHSSLQQMTNYVRENCHIAHLPVKAIQRMQRAVLGITLAILIALVLPSVFCGKEPLTALTEIKFDFNIQIEEEQPETIEEMANPGEAMREMLGGEERKPNVILEAIMNALVYIIGIAGCAAAVFVVARICRKLMNSFENGQDMDEIISLDDEGETLATKIQRVRKERDFKSVKNKIRKNYKKLIKKHMKGKPAGWETPEELEEKAGLKEANISEEIHAVYEKARYSQHECNEQDLARM